jgi:hypothetical protein
MNVRIGVLSTLALAVVLVLWATAASAADEKAPAPAAKPQTKCPITGNPIDKTLFVDAEGYRIYLCCKGCIDKVTADPKAAIEKIKANGEEPAKVPPPQTKCPIMGGKINKAIYVDAEGYRIYACCAMCPPKIKADPKAAIAKIRANGEEPIKIPEDAKPETK